MSWTEIEVKMAITLRNAGLSAGQIAKELCNKSRNAVIGKLSRLGISLPFPKVNGKTHNVKVKRANADTQRFVQIKKRQAGPVLPFDGKVKKEDGVKILDLQPGHCRWPYGDTEFYFCGRGQIAGISYCSYHHERSLRKNQPTTE